MWYPPSFPLPSLIRLTNSGIIVSAEKERDKETETIQTSAPALPMRCWNILESVSFTKVPEYSFKKAKMR